MDWPPSVQSPRRTPTLGDLDHPFAAVIAGEKPKQSARRRLQAIHDVFLDLQLPRRDPRLKLGDRRVAFCIIVRDDEAIHAKAFDDEETRNTARTMRGWRSVIL